MEEEKEDDQNLPLGQRQADPAETEKQENFAR